MVTLFFPLKRKQYATGGLHYLLLEEVLEVQIPQNGPTWLSSMAWAVPTLVGPEPLDQVAKNVPSWRACLTPPIRQVCICAHLRARDTLPPPNLQSSIPQQWELDKGSHLLSAWWKSSHSRVPPRPRARTYLTLLPVQIELVLANSHSPNGLD